MADTTIIGVYDDRTDADRAKKALLDKGVASSDVRTVDRSDIDSDRARGSAQKGDESMGEQISGFFGSLFGSNEEEKLGSQYLEAIRRGSTLVVVDADGDDDVRVAEQGHELPSVGRYRQARRELATAGLAGPRSGCAGIHR